jgi:F-type H+-transporting ATPase subunit a
MNEMMLRIFAEGATDGPQFPTIADFLPPAFLFDGTFFAINRIQLIRFVVVVAVLLFFGLTLSRAKKRSDAGNLIPTKPQLLIEMLFEFIKGLVFDVLGEKGTKRWLPLLTTLFCTIVFLNVTGVVPGLNLAGTAAFGIPLLLAFWVFYAYWKEAILDHGGGVKGFFLFLKAELFPPGFPVYVYPIYAAIELLQVFIVRPGSLAIRLFANMLSGHILIALCILTTQWFLFSAGIELKAFGILTFVGIVFFFLFELLVAVLQAYVFTLLACVYISLSFNHDAEHTVKKSKKSELVESDTTTTEKAVA